MEVHLYSKFCPFSLDRQKKQGLYATPELLLGDWRKRKKKEKNPKDKRTDLLNKNLILREDLMAKKMLAASELPPLDSEMKVVYLQVAFSSTGGDLLDSCVHQASAGKSFFPCGLFFLSYRRTKKMTMSLHEERNCKRSALPLVSGDGSVLLFTLHDMQARRSSTEIN